MPKSFMPKPFIIDIAHPSAYSIYWDTPDAKPVRRPNALVISLIAFTATAISSGVAVAHQFNRMPTPEQIAVIPPGAEGMNAYPVVETTDIWLAPHAD